MTLPAHDHLFDPPGPLPVLIDPDDLARPFILDCDLTYRGPVARVHVEKGFRCDMASVPRWAWPFIPRTDPRIVHAAVVHDRLYELALGERAVADAVFLTIMKKKGMPAIKRWAAYLAVRLFGGAAWRKARASNLN